MEISKINRSKKPGIWYMVSMKPESFAFSLYGLIASVVAANWLWMNVLYLCASVENGDLPQLVRELLSIHFLFAVVTLLVWHQLLRERGRNLLTHVTFFVWQGSKLFSACLEICSFTKFYKKLSYNTTKEVFGELSRQMVLGVLVIGVLEGVGLVLAGKYMRQRTPKKPKTVLAYSATYMDV